MRTALRAMALGGALLTAAAATATESGLCIPLLPDTSMTRLQARYRCNSRAPLLGLPAGPFTVTYLNGGGNALAILPLGQPPRGAPLIMAVVASADGARYAAGRFVWWDVGGRGATLYRDWPDTCAHTDCQRLAAS